MSGALYGSVIAGDYKGVVDYNSRKKCLFIKERGFLRDKITFINKETVSAWDVIDEDSRKSLTSGVIRGAAGAALFGPLGAVAGAASAKKKSKYKVSVQFKDGTKALLELDSTDYERLVLSLY